MTLRSFGGLVGLWWLVVLIDGPHFMDDGEPTAIVFHTSVLDAQANSIDDSSGSGSD